MKSVDSKRPLKVFLCHASADKPAVRDLYKRLVADGVDAWLDAESLIPGQNWRVEIPKAIRESDVVIVCLSEKSVNKEGYVQKEIKSALDIADEKPEGTIFIIPVRLEECKTPDRLSLYHWVDLFAEDGYQKLMRALRLRAEKIGAVVQSKKGWLGGFTSPVKKPDTQKPKPAPKAPVISKKSPRKWDPAIVVAIIGASATILAAIIANLPWKDWVAPSRDIATVTPTNIVTFTSLPSTSPFTSLLPTSTFTPVVPLLPIEIIDTKGVPMRLVPAGEFTMGTKEYENENPVHTVYLDGFYMDKYEVTNALYKACEDVGGCTPPQDTSSKTRSSYYNNPKFDNYPVIYVNWYQAKDYCEWRGPSTSSGQAHLPTEAQWEKAARGTDGRTYPWGEEIDCNKANYGGKGENGCVGDTTPVGSYESGKSPYGLYDMAGNVLEWVNDWYYGSYYKNSPSKNPLGPDSGATRVLRGGSWIYDDWVVRSAYRNGEGDLFIGYSVGFRCARDAKP